MGFPWFLWFLDVFLPWFFHSVSMGAMAAMDSAMDHCRRATDRLCRSPAPGRTTGRPAEGDPLSRSTSWDHFSIETRGFGNPHLERNSCNYYAGRTNILRRTTSDTHTHTHNSTVSEADVHVSICAIPIYLQSYEAYITTLVPLCSEKKNEHLQWLWDYMFIALPYIGSHYHMLPCLAFLYITHANTDSGHMIDIDLQKGRRRELQASCPST